MEENILLPEDIDRKEFTVSFRGYNTEEVDRFLHEIRESLEAGAAARDVLKRKVAAAELLAKDAKNHEEEYLQSISADKEAAERTLAEARIEGERIIREARNAAAGIMAEVRRRAGEMSGECKKDTDALIASARAEAEGTVAKAKSDADRTLYSAKIEAENIVSAANAERRSIISEAEAKAESILAAAKTGAEDILTEAKSRREAELRNVINLRDSAAEYSRSVKDACSGICRELEAELHNSASRIALVRKRSENREVAAMPDALAHAEELANPPSGEGSAAAMQASADGSARALNDNPAAPAAGDADSGASHDGYFSEEYKKVMTELFGSDETPSVRPQASPAHAAKPAPVEDDDTYDFIGTAADDSTYPSDSDFVDGIETTDDSVTSVFDGTVDIGTFDIPTDSSDDQMVDSVYKSFDDDDISDILGGI